MKKILVLDNYDSFTYNLVQLVEEITGDRPEVIRNDQLSLEQVDEYDTIILSPGPGLPKDAGIMPALIQQYYQQKPILGICLGHQAIAESFGGKLRNLTKVYHGFQTPIQVQEQGGVYANLSDEIKVGRYHSWVAEPADLPDCLLATAVDDQSEIMSLRHKEFPVVGLQYHPESILTPDGKQLVSNFLSAQN